MKIIFRKKEIEQEEKKKEKTRYLRTKSNLEKVENIRAASPDSPPFHLSASIFEDSK